MRELLEDSLVLWRVRGRVDVEGEGAVLRCDGGRVVRVAPGRAARWEVRFGTGLPRECASVAGVLSAPPARAALPGLIGEMAADPTLHTALLTRFGDIITRGLGDFLAGAADRGEIRSEVTADELAEAVTGIALVSLLARGTALDDGWMDRAATLILRGIRA